MPLYPKGNAPKPKRATYADEDEGSRTKARGVTYAGAKVAKGDYLSRLMAYAKARAQAMANQRVYIRPGPGGLGPASPANQPGYKPPARSGYDYTSEAARARARQVTYAGQRYPLVKQRKKTGAGDYDYPSEAEIAAAKMYRPPEALPSPGGGGGGAGGYPGYGGYGGYGGYPSYGGGGRGRGGYGSRGAPTYIDNNQYPRQAGYQMRPNIPAWLQAMVTWNIGG